MDLVFSSDQGNVADLLFDTPPITSLGEERFVRMCNGVAKRYDKMTDWIEVKPSSTENVLKVRDYSASTIGAHHEHENDPDHESHKLFNLIRHRVRRG